MCHTAMLPAESRYKGILTEHFDEATGGWWDHKYEHSVFQTVLNSVELAEAATPYVDPHPGREEFMVMTAKDDEWEDGKCEEQTNVDHKDYFIISSVESWRKLTLPNDSELKYYSEWDPHSETRKKWILICMAKCMNLFYEYLSFALTLVCRSFFMFVDCRVSFHSGR